ncbi:LAFE_0D04192g1_1 [Lachancea fermentati]|uniref:LAFE_0D04192g1_1 n=1 Tax=Lachancea fermentati TaxID=4955 RepID=A0A1G4MAZ7_LACFM|nr:LAFE_0D04192g1_1 [Lachancea fermentati]
MSDLTAILNQINDSLKATGQSLDTLQTQYRAQNALNDEAKSAIMKNALGDHTLEKVSLLSLKNGTILAYINSLLEIVGEKLYQTDATAMKGRQHSIEHRVVLERGVKPLEKKLAYQLDKLTRAYSRMESEYAEAEKRAMERTTQGNSSGDDEADSSDEEEEAMSYRPNASAMTTSGRSGAREEQKGAEEEEDSQNATYKPPKISAMLPPQHHFDDKFVAKDHRDRSGKSRMQAMEDYISEMSEQPEWESSVGANIVNHGRGGVKSLRDTEREQRVKNYEEDNFTRLHMQTSKAEKRMAKQRERMARVNMIGGEDFSIFNSKRKLEDSTSRKGSKKSRNAWERAKRNL